MAELNTSFAAIVGHCLTLQQTGIVPARTAQLFQAFTQELQGELNSEILSPLQDAELDDWTRFGKVRQRWEKYLRGRESAVRKKSKRVKTTHLRAQ